MCVRKMESQEDNFEIIDLEGFDNIQDDFDRKLSNILEQALLFIKGIPDIDDLDGFVGELQPVNIK